MSIVQAVLKIIAKLTDYIDMAIGTANANKEKRLGANLDQRIEDRRDAKRQLAEAKDAKAKRAAVRRIHRLG